jgi:hypothetical protein
MADVITQAFESIETPISACHHVTAEALTLAPLRAIPDSGHRDDVDTIRAPRMLRHDTFADDLLSLILIF